jgi:hypothetical protein
MQKVFRKAYSHGNVELWKHPEGHKFIRFKDSPLQGHEIPHPTQIPKSNKGNTNFVTTFQTEVGGKRQQIWAKEAGSEHDYESLKDLFKHKKVPFSRYAHHSRILKQLRAAGFESPEALGILHPKNGTPLMLTTHVRGKGVARGNGELEGKLENAGFYPQDLHDENVFHTKRGHSIIDASLFGPTDKKMLAKAIEQKQQPQGFFASLIRFIRRK